MSVSMHDIKLAQDIGSQNFGCKRGFLGTGSIFFSCLQSSASMKKWRLEFLRLDSDGFPGIKKNHLIPAILVFV
jgi:hypothetical protein